MLRNLTLGFFFRKWTGDFSATQASAQQVEQSYYMNRIKTLEESIQFLVSAELKRQYPSQVSDEELPKRSRQSKNRGKGAKRSQNEQEKSSFLAKLSKAFLDSEPIASCSRDSDSPNPEPSESGCTEKNKDDSDSIISMLSEPKLKGAETTFHLTNISLSINGTDLDQLTADQTLTHAFVDFLRFNTSNCFLNSLESNGIAYKDYMEGFFIAGFDLSTSAESGDPYYTPTVRVGQLRLWVKFDQPLPTDLTMLCYAEYPSLMELSREGKMKTSYSVK